jgi:hypothetical protein
MPGKVLREGEILLSRMGAIHTDCTELVELVHKAPAEEDRGIVGEVIQHVQGWVTRTMSSLARTPMTGVMGRTPLSEEDVKQMRRVISLLGTGR